MNLTKLCKARPEAAAIDHQHMVLFRKTVHHNRFHCTGRRTGQKKGPRPLRRICKLEHPLLILQHHSGKLRRTKIRNLLRTNEIYRDIYLTQNKASHDEKLEELAEEADAAADAAADGKEAEQHD